MNTASAGNRTIRAMETESDSSARDLRETLALAGARKLHDLLQEPAVKTTLPAALADIGVRAPANHLIYFCVEKLTLGVGSVLGAAAASRIEEVLRRIPATRKLLDKVAMLDRQESDKDRLRELLLNEL